ncbi:MAG: PQQ-binding-like beta-propeller repeat protein [Mycobacterium sp.]|uniref:Rv3212 family protein n=1 Tax=Mycobacterium sp. TaxID=1785 RepID=UPI002627B45B|nr:PQQ-binding-like beta-propeller repeat protein [Mycobacterium sp.]MDI3314866.1 PQQ-binding-like beta-propeller repeat protein [Mycobacterium sp.]
MVRPERRTTADVAAAVAIAVVVATVAALIWWTSDARATISRPATQLPPPPVPARAVPDALRQLWTATSTATARPVVVSGTVVTGEGREVDGRDPATGKVRWSYSRDSDLCAVSWVYRYAVAVYRDDRGCGQVSTIDATTGRRGPARTGYADDHVHVSSDGTTVLSVGDTRLELWRSDMVRMLSYGETDARVKPSARGLHSGCTLVSAAASSSAAAVLEACGQQTGLRLVLLRPGKEEDEPEQRVVPEPGIGADSNARVLTVSDTTTAVYLPSPTPRVEVIDETGTTVASTLLPHPAAPSTAVSRPGNLVSWWTGDAVMVFDAASLTYRYTIAAAGPAVPIGPATIMAGRLLVPVTGGMGVYDPVSGANERYLPVSRGPAKSAVIPAVSGTRVFEQRDTVVVALG